MGNTLYKKDLVSEFAKKEKITKVYAETLIEDLLDLITEKLVEGNNVKLANFFNFFVRSRAEKKTVNPRSGEAIIIPANRTVVARMTKPLKEKIRGKK